MKKLFLALFALACAFSIHGVMTGTAQAQGYSDDDDYAAPRRRYRQDDYRDEPRRYREPYYSPYDYRQRRRRVSDGCRATIRATGRGFLTGFSSRTSAINAWRREAQQVYGRSFSWESAKNKSISCSPYIATQRCTASGRPCS